MAVSNRDLMLAALASKLAGVAPTATHRFDATSAPGVTDDESKGFAPGSVWFAQFRGVWVCTDATAGAAVWAEEEADVSAIDARVTELEAPTVFAITGIAAGGTPSYEVDWADGTIQTLDLAQVDSGAALTLTFTGTPLGKTGQIIVTQREATAATIVLSGATLVGGGSIAAGDDERSVISVSYAGAIVIASIAAE